MLVNTNESGLLGDCPCSSRHGRRYGWIDAYLGVKDDVGITFVELSLERLVVDVLLDHFQLLDTPDV